MRFIDRSLRQYKRVYGELNDQFEDNTNNFAYCLER